jgi:flagella basal body P-ring formation protein FlgA
MAHGDCISVSADRIVATDLAKTFPLLASVDPSAVFGYSPNPGGRRILEAHQITRFARRYGLPIDGSFHDICVERHAKPISREELTHALQEALGSVSVRLEVLDFSSQPFPPGKLIFSRNGLSKPPESAPESSVLWRGKLVYGGGRSFAVWARVRVTQECTWFVATESIPGGTTIRPEHVEQIFGWRFPFPGDSIRSLDGIIGKTTRRSILIGRRFTPEVLAEPLDVARGETIQVVVREGEAELSFRAIAQTSGRRGDAILLRNPSNGRNFRAVVEKKGHAVVRPAAGA